MSCYNVGCSTLLTGRLEVSRECALPVARAASASSRLDLRGERARDDHASLRALAGPS